MTFPVYFTFDKTIGDINGRFEVSVSNEQLLSTIMKEICSKLGIDFNENYQFSKFDGVMLEMNATVEYNDVTKGNQLLISLPGNESHSPKKCDDHIVTTNKLWKPLAIVGIILTIVGLIILITIYIINCTKILSYGVVIDAGSTSSKIYLYSWPSNKFVYNGDVIQVSSCKAEPGISDYEDNPNLCFAGIKNCLDKEIIPNIPKDKKAKSYIYLGATAGMRMLSYKNPNATQKILQYLRSSLATYALKINNTISDITIIPGSIEGLTGWITVNYLLNNFPKTGDDSKSIIGALDMGGASTQVTFLVSTSNSSDIFNINLYGKHYRVYSHSYLCYGKSQAELRFLSVMLHLNNFTLNSSNPCMLIGEEATFNIKELFYKPCIYGKFAIENYGYEVIPPKNLIEDNANFTFYGTSNLTQCNILVKSLFNTSKCTIKSCAFNGVYQPHLTGKFGAFSAYPLIKQHLNPKNEDFNLTRYKDQLRSLCDQKRKSDIFGEDVYAKWQCFDLTFLIEILSLIGFDDSNWRDIDFIDKIKDSNVGWSLGYMIDKTALIPKEKHFLPLEDSLFAILVIVLIVILLLAIVFIILAYKISNKKMAWPRIICEENEEQKLLSSALTRD